jgi:stage II sporulation protein M
VQNARISLGAVVLGIFTFGAAALVLTPLVYFVLGFILAQFVAIGLNATFMIPAIMTHGIIEIPIIVIATAVAVRIGAVVTRPPKGSGVGHAWTIAFADMVKLWLGVIAPGLMLAALIEAYITPVVLKLFFGS